MSERETTEGQLLFDRFLTKNRINNGKAAEELGVSRPTVFHWRIAEKRPTDHQRAKIEVWTNGAIPAVTWRTAEERVEIRNTRPFLATGTGG